jgi:hypothetical protein
MGTPSTPPSVGISTAPRATDRRDSVSPPRQMMRRKSGTTSARTVATLRDFCRAVARNGPKRGRAAPIPPCKSRQFDEIAATDRHGAQARADSSARRDCVGAWPPHGTPARLRIVAARPCACRRRRACRRRAVIASRARSPSAAYATLRPTPRDIQVRTVAVLFLAGAPGIPARAHADRAFAAPACRAARRVAPKVEARAFIVIAPAQSHRTTRQ